MTIDELKKYASDWGSIEVVAPKNDGLIKKGWIKRYELNASFDEFDQFEALIYTDNHKLRGNICVGGMANVINSNERAKALLLECINYDLKEGYTFLK